MALFRSNSLRFVSIARDVAFGTDVRALQALPVASTAFTITFTSTTAITQTVDPYTNISNQPADNRLNLGWAMNQNAASVDGMGSGDVTTGLLRKRYIPPGVWGFFFRWTANAPALLATRPVTFTYSVYRVAANGGARTLLFTATSAAETGNSGTGTASSASQPGYVIEPNETIHIAVQVTSQATSGLLGGTTNTVITATGSPETGGMNFPNSLRDQFIDSSAGTGEAVGARSNLVDKELLAAGEGVVAYDYLAEFFRTFNGVGAGVGDRDLLTVLKFVQATGKGAGSRSLLVRKDQIGAVGKGLGARTLIVRKDQILSIGEGDGDIAKLATFVRAFAATGDAIGDIRRVVIFVRDFAAVGEAAIRPRIALDWDDLPDPGGGGGVTINTFRPLFVFDD